MAYGLCAIYGGQQHGSLPLLGLGVIQEGGVRGEEEETRRHHQWYHSGEAPGEEGGC